MISRSLILLLVGILASCTQINAYNPDQNPLISVSTDTPPVISWTPQGAETLRIYEGKYEGATGHGENLAWMLIADQANGLKSPITYGQSVPNAQARQARELIPGESYTLILRRRDPNGISSNDPTQVAKYVYETTLYFKPGQAAITEQPPQVNPY